MDIDLLKYMLLATLLITQRGSHRGGDRTSNRIQGQGGDNRAETVPPCLPAEAGCDTLSQPFLRSFI